MIDYGENYYFMVEPDREGSCSEIPVEDELTEMVDFIFSNAKANPFVCYRGFHVTKCGKFSDNKEWLILGCIVTNNLAPFYIRHYRNYIPQVEIDKTYKLFKILKEHPNPMDFNFTEISIPNLDENSWKILEENRKKRK